VAVPASAEAALASAAVNLLGAARWATRTAATGMAVTGTATTGMAVIGTATTGTGTVTLIMFTTTLFLSVASASHGGGVGAGAEVRGGDGTRIRMDTTVTAIPTGMVTAMGMDMAVAMVNMATDKVAMVNMATDKVAMVKMATANMAKPANPELPNYNVGCNGPVITADLLTESWGHKPGTQFERTNGTTGT